MSDAAPVGDLVTAVSGALQGNQDKAAAPIPAPVARRVPQPGPDREMSIRLRGGRRVRARIAPAVARRQDLAAVARVSAENNRRAFGALRRHRAAIARLMQSHDALAKKVAVLERQSNLALAAEQLQRIRDAKLLDLRAQIQGAATIVNSVQAVAYGEKGSIFTTNNLLLAGNQLFWSLLDPVLRSAGVVNATSATVLAAVAPIATLFTGEILLGDRQHVRFISGITTVSAPGIAREALPVAGSLWPEFRQRTDVPVTVTALDPVSSRFLPLTGRVNQGVLEIQLGTSAISTSSELLKPFQPIRVAWIVDTGADGG